MWEFDSNGTTLERLTKAGTYGGKEGVLYLQVAHSGLIIINTRREIILTIATGGLIQLLYSLPLSQHANRQRILYTHIF